MPGPASPDTVIGYDSLNIHGSLHFPALPAAVLGRASSLSPGKWEYKRKWWVTSSPENLKVGVAPLCPFKEMVEPQSSLDPWVTSGRRDELVSWPIYTGLYQKNNKLYCTKPPKFQD